MKCIHPTLISNGKSSYYVPCGRCAWCRRRKQDDWFFRMAFEARLWPFVSFVTLTYDDDNVPVQMVDSDGVCRYSRGFDFVSLSDSEVSTFAHDVDVTRYFKRLTKRLNLLKVHQRFYQKPSGQFYLKPSPPSRKYVCVSEFGSKSSRPHFHFILFSSADIDCSLDWPFGQVVQGPADLGSFRYVTKYLLKGSKSDCKRLMASKGIGADYINFDSQFIKFDQDSKVYLPRYLRDRWTTLIDSQFLEHEKSLGLIDSDAKHCRAVQSFKDSMMDNLLFNDPHSEFQKMYRDLYGSLDGFDGWLHDVYLQDYEKQVKINNHGKC